MVFAFSVFGYVTATIASYFVNSDASDPSSDVADEVTIKTVLAEVRALRQQIHYMRTAYPRRNSTHPT
jgi:voltage-gated potassium channel